MWVLAVPASEAGERGRGIVWSALSMDERCEAVEKLGGSFYRDSKECLDLEL